MGYIFFQVSAVRCVQGGLGNSSMADLMREPVFVFSSFAPRCCLAVSQLGGGGGLWMFRLVVHQSAAHPTLVCIALASACVRCAVGCLQSCN